MILFLFSFFLDFLYFWREEGREKEKERNISVWVPPTYPLLGTWPETQARALTGNQTSNTLVRRPMLNPLSHTSHGQRRIFNNVSNIHNVLLGRKKQVIKMCASYDPILVKHVQMYNRKRLEGQVLKIQVIISWVLFFSCVLSITFLQQECISVVMFKMLFLRIIMSCHVFLL